MNRAIRRFLLAAPLLVSGCAPSGSAVSAALDPSRDPAGFWAGLWHGFILFFTFVVSLFNDGVGVYEAYNRGSLYDLGFVLGVMIFFGGSGGGGVCGRSRGRS